MMGFEVSLLTLQLFPERHYPNYTNPEFPIILFLLPFSLGSGIHGLVWTDTGRDNDIREKYMAPFVSLTSLSNSILSYFGQIYIFSLKPWKMLARISKKAK